MNCEFAYVFWFYHPLALRTADSSDTSIFDWICFTFEKLDHDRRSLFCFSILELSRARNELIFDEKERSPLEVVEAARQNHDDFLKALKLNPPSYHQSHHPPLGALSADKWEALPNHLWKLNVDASRKRDGQIKIGVVIRDWLGSDARNPCGVSNSPSASAPDRIK
ncbi:hypothetical protein PIB30_051476 [Stylosanthes scabra]|uniref:Uncharacterized protein n=1 Tax=Stylosanthes scabra TaxID=79078 RepID=A0ABU6WIB0_9FABA|nr:hypothetical protein [Stylosanthes scabra]